MMTFAHIPAEELIEQRHEQERPSLSSTIRYDVLAQKGKKEP